MKQTLLLFIGVIIFIVVVGFFTKDLTQKSVSSPTETKKEVSIGETKISVEVADDENERKKGLGGKDSLNEDEGMLFVFPEKTSEVVFWMKEMKFPIDIIWIADDKIVKIEKSASPEPGVPDDKLKLYGPGTAINYVLEVKAGFSDKNNIKPGDTVLLTL